MIVVVGKFILKRHFLTVSFTTPKKFVKQKAWVDWIIAHFPFAADLQLQFMWSYSDIMTKKVITKN